MNPSLTEQNILDNPLKVNHDAEDSNASIPVSTAIPMTMSERGRMQDERLAKMPKWRFYLFLASLSLGILLAGE
jgi:hypothetical protein